MSAISDRFRRETGEEAFHDGFHTTNYIIWLEARVREQPKPHASNGVIRIGRKGLKKFAFGDGAPFEVDVVVVFQAWVCVDEGFREQYEDRVIPTADMPEYHKAAVQFVHGLMAEGNGAPTTAEALDFLARLREQYDEVAVFFQPRLREELDSPASSEVELQFSPEAP